MVIFQSYYKPLVVLLQLELVTSPARGRFARFRGVRHLVETRTIRFINQRFTDLIYDLLRIDFADNY